MHRCAVAARCCGRRACRAQADIAGWDRSGCVYAAFTQRLRSVLAMGEPLDILHQAEELPLPIDFGVAAQRKAI